MKLSFEEFATALGYDKQKLATYSAAWKQLVPMEKKVLADVFDTMLRGMLMFTEIERMKLAADVLDTQYDFLKLILLMTPEDFRRNFSVFERFFGLHRDMSSDMRV